MRHGLLAASLLLVACADGGGGLGGGVATFGEGYLRYSASDYRYAFGQLGLPVIVVGNPLPVPPQAFREAVIASMPGNRNPPAYRYAPAGPNLPPGSTYVALAFNAPMGEQSHTLCRDPAAIRGGGAGTPVSVNAAFCDGGEALSWVSGATDLSGPDDPRLGRLMEQVVLRLFPPENPNRRPDGDGRRGRIGWSI
jgi:hypothetical protein